MKRFWDDAAVAELPDGFGVVLDGRPLHLPGGGGLRVARRALAEALAEEWGRAGGARGGEAGLEELPLTRLVGTAQDRIAPDPEPTVSAIAAYGESDLLCYRAGERALAEKQARAWQPQLDWAARELDALLRVTTGLMPVPQEADALAALRRAVAAHTPLELAALGVAVPALGSLVLGLALSRGRIDAAEAHRLATLDETHQEAFWGTDAEAVARRERMAADIALSERLLRLARA